MFWHSSKERNGRRFWWHLGRRDAERAVIAVEFYWLSGRFGVHVGHDYDGWNLSLRVPPFALYVSLDGFRLWRPVGSREFEFYVSEWRVRLTPWGRCNEWRKADPWWVRGVSLDIRDLVLGKMRYDVDQLALVPCSVPMPEGTYPAVAKIERFTRKRSRWFASVETSAWLDIPKGIPHAGKGENSWDCGDDGLFGIGGATVDDAIRRAQESVTKSRKRYGRASEAAMQRALS